MANLQSFRGLRPPKSKVLDVAAPPYDVVNSAEARAYAHGKPDSFFHVSRPEVGMPEGTDEHADAAYIQGARSLADFVHRGVLVRDAGPRFYVYRQKMGAHVQTGLIKKHGGARQHSRRQLLAHRGRQRRAAGCAPARDGRRHSRTHRRSRRHR